MSWRIKRGQEIPIQVSQSLHTFGSQHTGNELKSQICSPTRFGLKYTRVRGGKDSTTEDRGH